VPVPNKTIYVADGDLPLYQQAQELAGGNLSAAITKALRRWVDAADALNQGYRDVVVRVGLEKGRKVRFVGMLVGDYLDPTSSRADHYRVYQGRKGSYVLHLERMPEFKTLDADGKPAGWRGWMGIGDVRYGATPHESTLEVVDTLDGLRDKVPQELFDMVARAAVQPTVEDLDI
jgi:EXLDI family protein